VSTPTVLVIVQAQDGTADLIVDSLLARSVDVARINTADFPGALSLVATPERIDSPGWLCVRGRRIDLASVCSWWFLECNPVGQWGWLVEETGLPIADAIADELVRAA